jgi:hypothetical protein
MCVVLSPKQCLTTRLSYHWFFANEAPHALIAKTKKQPITRAGGNTFLRSYILALSLGTNGRVCVAGGGLVKTSTLNHATSFAN